MMPPARHVLVFGLSADPIHRGHVDLVVEATKKLNDLGFEMDRVLIIPVYRRNPTGSKPKDDLGATFAHRLAMCQLAADEVSGWVGELGASVEVSAIEQELARRTGTPNYTVETLQALQAKETPGTGWILLLGSDLLSGDDPELGDWRQPEKLVRLAAIALYPRPGYRSNPAFLREMERKGACFIHLDGVALTDIEARQIRRRLAAGVDPLDLSREGLLSGPVASYIKEHGLYQANGRNPFRIA